MTNYKKLPDIDPVLLLDFKKWKKAHPLISFCSGDARHDIDADGVYSFFRANTPKIVSRPEFNATGLICERGNTNLLPNSTSLDGVQGFSTVPGTTAVSPLGTTVTLVRESGNGSHIMADKSVAISTEGYYCSSCFVKIPSDSQINRIGIHLIGASTVTIVDFLVESGKITGMASDSSKEANYQSVGDGWYRIYIKGHILANTTAICRFYSWDKNSANNTYPAPANASLFITGMQLSPTFELTSHIPTNGSTVSRLGEAVAFGSVGNFLNQQQATLFIDFQYPEFVSGWSDIIMFSAVPHSDTERFDISTRLVGGEFQISTHLRNTTFTHTFTGFSPNQRILAAIAYGGGKLKSAINGQYRESNGNKTVTFSRFSIGCSSRGGDVVSLPASTIVQSVSLYDRSLSSQEMIALTT